MMKDGRFGNCFGFLAHARDGFIVANKSALQVAIWVTILGCGSGTYVEIPQLGSPQIHAPCTRAM